MDNEEIRSVFCGAIEKNLQRTSLCDGSFGDAGGMYAAFCVFAVAI